MAEHVLTIDLGTSGPKVAVFTLRGDYLEGTFEPVELLLGEHGAAEQRPADWWEAIVAGVRRLGDRGALPEDGFAAISVTSQWSGTVAVDRDGEPVCDAVIWMDCAGAEHIGRIVGGPVRVPGYDPLKLRRWVERTGGVPSLSGKDPIGHIHWLRAARPELSSRTATVPRAEGLAEPAADGGQRRDLRLHRDDLGDRQPRPWPRSATTTSSSRSPACAGSGSPTWCRRPRSWGSSPTPRRPSWGSTPEPR